VSSRATASPRGFGEFAEGVGDDGGVSDGDRAGSDRRRRRRSAPKGGGPRRPVPGVSSYGGCAMSAPGTGRQCSPAWWAYSEATRSLAAASTRALSRLAKPASGDDVSAQRWVPVFPAQRLRMICATRSSSAPTQGGGGPGPERGQDQDQDPGPGPAWRRVSSARDHDLQLPARDVLGDARPLDPAGREMAKRKLAVGACALAIVVAVVFVVLKATKTTPTGSLGGRQYTRDACRYLPPRNSLLPVAGFKPLVSGQVALVTRRELQGTPAVIYVWTAPVPGRCITTYVLEGGP
jgi:hypothetical protein